MGFDCDRHLSPVAAVSSGHWITESKFLRSITFAVGVSLRFVIKIAFDQPPSITNLSPLYVDSASLALNYTLIHNLIKSL